MNQEWKQVVFFNEKLNDNKRNNFVYDQEFYEDFDNKRHYFIPKEFVFYIYHKVLKYLRSQHNLSETYEVDLVFVKFYICDQG